MARVSSRRSRRAQQVVPCGDGRRGHTDASPRPGAPGARRSSTEQSNVAVLRRVVEEIWNGCDLPLADVLFAPGYANHGGIVSDVVSGPEAIKLGVVLCRAAFPDFRVSVDAVVSDDNLVELTWTARSTPPGRLSGTTLTRLAGGQIQESWTTWSPVALLRRLGAMPRTEPTGPDA